jgi:hypothetical protein
MSTPTQNQHCPLLDLPVETLQRITDLLDTHEELPVVRRTCKTLDNVTFDRFADASFAEIKCCIFSEARWLRLKEILGGPSRITSRIRNVEFTTHLFDRREKNELELVLNDDYLENYWNDIDQSEEAREYEESKATEVRDSPNLALMMRVLRDVQTVLPPQAVTLDLVQNLDSANSHVQAHLEALVTLASTQAQLRIGGLALTQSAIWALFRNFQHLPQDMLRHAPELRTFKLESGRSAWDHEEDSDLLAVGGPLKHVYEILRSADELRVQYLDLELLVNPQEIITIAQHLLESTVSCRLASLTLSGMSVEEDVLLEALPRWAPSLLTLSLNNVRLFSMHKGWSAVLRTLSTMPQLSYLKLRGLDEQHVEFRCLISVSLDRETSIIARPGGERKYEGRMVVSLGLEKLLTEPLPYLDDTCDFVGQRSVDGYLDLV